MCARVRGGGGQGVGEKWAGLRSESCTSRHAIAALSIPTRPQQPRRHAPDARQLELHICQRQGQVARVARAPRRQQVGNHHHLSRNGFVARDQIGTTGAAGRAVFLPLPRALHCSPHTHTHTHPPWPPPPPRTPAPPPPAWRGWPQTQSRAGTGACTRQGNSSHQASRGQLRLRRSGRAGGGGGAHFAPARPVQGGLAGPTRRPRPILSAVGRSRGCAGPGPG